MELHDIGFDITNRLAGQFGIGIDQQQHRLDPVAGMGAQLCGAFQRDMTGAFLEMDEADMGRARFDSSIDTGFGGQAADLDLGFHGAATSGTNNIRHPELVSGPRPIMLYRKRS